jgi:LacI family transcriptional regulator
MLDLVGLYNAGAGNRGIAAALQQAGRAQEIVWIAHDFNGSVLIMALS